MPVLDGPMTMPVLDGVKPMAITLSICGTSESLFWKRKKSIYCWTRSRPTWTFGESNDQVRDKSESKYQRVQDKSETIEKRLESGLESETGLEYYSPTKNTDRPIRFEHSTRWRWNGAQTVLSTSVNTEVEDFPTREKSECGVIVNIKEQTILKCSLYRITFLLIIHWIMWSDQHRPFSSTSASVYESKLVHSRPVNQVIISLALPVYSKEINIFLHVNYEIK